MSDAYRTIDGFFAKARALREAFERHLGAAPAQRQVWEIVRGADGGAFLRANAVRVLPQALLAELVVAVQSWSALTLGLARASVPELRLLVGGCGEPAAVEDDDGLWGWRLTLPPEAGARAAGGDLELAPGAGGAAAVIAPDFNRLAAWDARLAAGTRAVTGGIDPAAGLLTLRGRLHGDGVALAGALELSQVRSPLLTGAAEVTLRWQSRGSWTGHLGLRLGVGADGNVAEAVAVCDRLVGAAPGAAAAPLVADALAVLRTLRFPRAAEPTRIHFAIVSDPAPAPAGG